jgi:C4-dicarboxylate-specific signal transduction histidine kinase
LGQPTPLRRELLSSFGILFTGAILVAGLGVTAVLPLLGSRAEGVLFIVILVIVDLVVLFLFGSVLLRRRLVEPMESLAADARRIAEGDLHHRVGPLDSLELEHLRQSVHAMADRLIEDQRRLAKNVESLDLTNQELIRARDQVVHAARLASVGTLAAGIAHEVGNPLAAILAFADVAKSRLSRGGNDVELLDSIRDEAYRIDRIVRGLLEYARPRKGGATPMSPGRVLDRVRELLDNQGKLDRLKCTWSVAPDVPDVVMDPQQLEQVLVNLALNAIDAVEGTEDPRLSVTIAVEEPEVARLPARRVDDPPGIDYRHRRRLATDEVRGVDPLFNAEHVVVIQVVDNGSGIPEDDLENIFDPFFTTKELGKGTGLGLSICARLVEGMGGHIQASNAPQGGACFTIRLPGANGTSERVLDREPQHEARDTL